MPSFFGAAEVLRTPETFRDCCIFLHGGLMVRRAIAAFAILIAISQTATAGVPLFGHVSCAVVRFYVAKYSEAAAETWARGHGATVAEIETARHCLHSANVQAASSAVKSQVIAPVTGRERAQHDPAERNPDLDAVHAVPVQAQRADAEQDNHDNKPSFHGLIGPKKIEDRFAANVGQMKDRPAPSDRKTSTLRQRYVGLHRARSARVAGHSKWLKRLWDHLTWPRQFSVAFLHFKGSRQ